MRRRGRGIRLQFGYSSICRLAVRAGLENEMLERLRVVQPLGGVEDFDAGETVGGVVVEGNAVRNLLRGLVIGTSHGHLLNVATPPFFPCLAREPI